MELPVGTSIDAGSALVKLHNCRILWKNKLVREDLWVKNGIIQDPMSIFFEEKQIPDFQVDCRNLIVAPGYIDIHLNGGFQVDFSSNVGDPVNGLEKVAKSLLQYGVTSFCPTIVTSPDHIYHQIIPKMQGFDGKNKAGILGIHLEGPFVSKEKRGAHPLKHIKELKNGFETLIETYQCLDNVKVVTVAPEIENCPEVVKQLTSLGIKVAMGHSSSTLEQAEKAVNKGASIVTHLFNAMKIFHNSIAVKYLINCLPALLNSERDVSLWRMLSVILITDAITAMGLEPGTYQLGQQLVTIDGVGAYLKDSNILAGSIATMCQCVKNFKSATDCSIEAAIEAATLHPARCLGVEDKKGTLDYGSDADFVLLDDDLNVKATFVAGNNVYKSPDLTSEQLQFIPVFKTSKQHSFGDSFIQV